MCSLFRRYVSMRRNQSRPASFVPWIDLNVCSVLAHRVCPWRRRMAPQGTQGTAWARPPASRKKLEPLGYALRGTRYFGGKRMTQAIFDFTKIPIWLNIQLWVKKYLVHFLILFLTHFCNLNVYVCVFDNFIQESFYSQIPSTLFTIRFHLPFLQSDSIYFN